MIRLGLDKNIPEFKNNPGNAEVKSRRREFVKDLSKIAFGGGAGLSLGYLLERARRKTSKSPENETKSIKVIFEYIDNELERLETVCLKNHPPKEELSDALGKTHMLGSYSCGCKDMISAIPMDPQKKSNFVKRIEQAQNKIRINIATLEIKLQEINADEDPEEDLPRVGTPRNGRMNA